MIKHKWSEMNNQERNKLISKEVLNLDCFQTLEGLRWYEKHYNLGNWHYTTNILDAIDLSNRIITDNIEMKLIISQQDHQCQIILKDNNQSIGDAISESLSESICLAVLKYKGISIEE